MVTVVQTAPIFPTLDGLGFDVNRTPVWNTNVMQAVSGRKTSIRFWNSPLYQYELTYDFLRSSALFVGDSAHAEYQSLLGFFNQVFGRSTPWLFNDVDDNNVTGQPIDTGDGATAAFQLIRTLGGFAEPVLAPNVVSAVYVSSVAVSSSLWTVSAYGTTAPGVLTLSSAPASSAPITADFTFYWPSRFMDDTMSFNKFMKNLWENKKVSFETEK